MSRRRDGRQCWPTSAAYGVIATGWGAPGQPAGGYAACPARQTGARWRPTCRSSPPWRAGPRPDPRTKRCGIMRSAVRAGSRRRARLWSPRLSSAGRPGRLWRRPPRRSSTGRYQTPGVDQLVFRLLPVPGRVGVDELLAGERALRAVIRHRSQAWLGWHPGTTSTP